MWKKYAGVGICAMMVACGGDAKLVGQAYDDLTACKVPTNEQPTLSDCEASCYVQAYPNCLEITDRLMYPQPGEADGGKLYSNLDVCVAQCGQ